MTYYSINIGTLHLTEVLDVSVPQSYAAYYETVRVNPGTYPVYIHLASDKRIHSLVARATGTTIACFYGRNSDNLIGRQIGCSVQLPTYGNVSSGSGLLAQAQLADVFVREGWDTDVGLNTAVTQRMWRLTIRPELKIQAIVDGRPYYSTLHPAILVLI